MDSLTFIFQYYPMYVMLLLALCVILFFVRWWLFRTGNDGNRKKLLLVLLAISVFGFIVRAEFMPQRHYLFFDEQSNIEVAWMLQNYGVIASCLVGSIDDCRIAKLYSNPAGYHVLLSIWFRIAGASEKSAYIFSAIVGAVSILAAGYLAYMVFGSMSAAFFSALLLCFLPIHLKYSAATCLNIVSFLFLILFFITFDRALKTKLRIDFVLHAAVALFFINIRGENWLIVMAVYFIVIIEGIFRLRKKKVPYNELITNIAGDFRKTDVIFALVIFLAVIPVIIFSNIIVSMDKIGWVVSLPGLLAKFTYQLPQNLYFWFSCHNTMALSIISFLGMLLYGIKNELRTPLIWLAVFVTLLFGYSAYEGGLFCFHENDRFSMILNVPLIIWGGYGLAQISGLMSHHRSGVLITVAVLALTVASFGQTFKYLMDVRHPWADSMSEARRIISDNFPSLPIVSDYPSYYTVMSGDQQVFIINGSFLFGNNNLFLHSAVFPLSSERQSLFKPKKHMEYLSRFPDEAVMAGFFGYEAALDNQSMLLKYYTVEECEQVHVKTLSFPVCHIKLHPEYLQGIQSEGIVQSP